MNIATRTFRQDPYPILAGIREESPAAVVEINGLRMWLVTRYEDARQVLADPASKKDLVAHRRRIAMQCLISPARRARLPHAMRRSLLDRDGADHRRLAQMLHGYFGPEQVAQYRPTLQRIVNQILDELPVGEPLDLVAELARPFVVTFICDLFGVPGDERDEFPDWENEMLTGTSIEEVEHGGRQLYDLALRLIDVKRQHPGDDIFTHLVRLHDQHGALDTDELASTFVTLLDGGAEAMHAIGIGLLLLLSHPDQVAALSSDPSLLAGCVDEILRYESPFKMLPPRFSLERREFDGLTIPAGELVAVSAASANRDPARFPDPERFDITRAPKGHLAFGHGPHHCPGARVARAMMEIALGSFVERFPDSRLLVPADQVRWRAGQFMRRLNNLPAVLAYSQKADLRGTRRLNSCPWTADR
jgi:cytochrome P450